MGVDAGRGLDRGAGVAGGRGDLIRQRAAVGVAQHDARSAALGERRGMETRRGPRSSFQPSMACSQVVDDLAAVRLQGTPRCRRCIARFSSGEQPEHLADVQGGGLAVDGHDRGLDLEEAADLGVLGGADALLAGGAEGGEQRA
jgi:hypothetical protein